MIKIGKSVIGKNSPCYIIAEAGVNHNGDLNLAKQLIKQAKIAGADCVKFQTFKAEQIITKSAPKAKYQLEVTDKSESQFEMLKNLELERDAYVELVKYCNEIQIEFMSTPYNHEDADFLSELGVNSYKIASGQLVEYAFLKHVAKKGKPMIVSTGMANMTEVAKAIDAIRSAGNEEFIMLQCTTNYPSNIEDSNIKAMKAIGDAFQVLVGYSDHVDNNYACYSAVALGAKVIEKHFTLNRNMKGPDHSSSLDPDGLQEMIKGVRAIEASLGSGLKTPSIREQANTEGMRRSIATKIRIKKGEEFTENNIGFKRPATGLAPEYYEQLLGRVALENIEEDTLLHKWMINWK